MAAEKGLPSTVVAAAAAAAKLRLTIKGMHLKCHHVYAA